MKCRDCHPEHQGSTALLTLLKIGSFPHNATGYSLASHSLQSDGRAFACSDCHGRDITQFDPAVCNTCHQQIDSTFLNPHIEAYGTDCLGCHDGVETLSKNFDHGQVSFKLEGKHGGVQCESCHLNAHSTSDFKSIPTNCSSCHQKDDVHKGQLGAECEACHTPSAWKPSNYDHNLSAFKLIGAHATVPCANCHVNGVFKGTQSTCYGCHQKDDIHKASLGQNCDGCHTTQAWKPSTFDHKLSSFILSGAHANVLCEKCHINNVFSGTPSNCYACHQKDDNHAGRFGQNCNACHTTQAWRPATFNHNLSFFKLVGAHASVACAKCHVNNIFKGTQSACIACHQQDDIHQGSLGQDCSSCHTPQTWSGASFDHNLAAFPLTGAHTNVACAKCHANNVFKGTPTTCYGCHQKDDNHAGRLGQDCSSCHTSQTWLGASFDHNLSAFKLTGAHVSVLCTNCHINNIFSGTPQACSSCHADPVYHAGIFPGQACSTCHTTSAWLPAAFTGLHTFPMDHGGGNNTCRNCHPSALGIWTCFTCHNQNDETSKHLNRGVTNFSDCMLCHPSGRKN